MSVIFIPFYVKADDNGLVPCNPTCDATGNCSGQCSFSDFFTLLSNIYHFIVWSIATPLAIIAFIIGAILMLVSSGNSSLVTKGKEILKWATIGLVLVYCSWIIINFILTAIGYSNAANWSTISF